VLPFKNVKLLFVVPLNVIAVELLQPGSTAGCIWSFEPVLTEPKYDCIVDDVEPDVPLMFKLPAVVMLPALLPSSSHN
jgi:hypothetical protein